MTLNSPDFQRLAAILPAAGLVVGQAGSTVTRAVTPDDALRVVRAMEEGGFSVGVVR